MQFHKAEQVLHHFKILFKLGLLVWSKHLIIIKSMRKVLVFLMDIVSYGLGMNVSWCWDRASLWRLLIGDLAILIQVSRSSVFIIHLRWGRELIHQNYWKLHLNKRESKIPIILYLICFYWRNKMWFITKWKKN